MIVSTNKYQANFLFLLALTALIFLIYGQTYNFGHNLDDNFVYDAIPETKSIAEGVKTIFQNRYNKLDYRPITILSFYIEDLAFKGSTLNIAHSINVFLYLLLCCLLFYFLKSIPLKNKNDKYYLFIVIIFLFAAHPIHANVVSSLKSRDNILSMIFLTTSLIFLTKAFSKQNYKSFAFILISIALTLIGTLAKKDALGYVLIAPITIFYFFPNKRKYALLFALITFIIFANENAIINALAPIDKDAPNGILRFTENPEIGNSLFKNIITALYTNLLYLTQLAIPKGYYFYFGYNQIVFPEVLSLKTILSLILFIGTLTIGFYYRKKNKLILYGVLFYYSTIFYCSNLIIPVAGIVAARYAFIASFGFSIFIVVLINEWIKNSRLKYGLFFLIISLFAYKSFERVRVWKDLETLVTHDIPFLNHSHEAQRIAASTYLEIADKSKELSKKETYLNKATKHIRRANEIYDKNAVTHQMEGIIHFKSNELDSAIQSLKKALELENTANYKTIEIIGDAYYLRNDFKEARKHYQAILKDIPYHQEMINKISTTYYDEKDINALIQFNDSLISLHPNFPAPYENLGYLNLLEGDTLTAKKYFQIAFKNGLKNDEIEKLFDF